MSYEVSSGHGANCSPSDSQVRIAGGRSTTLQFSPAGLFVERQTQSKRRILKIRMKILHNTEVSPMFITMKFSIYCKIFSIV